MAGLREPAPGSRFSDSATAEAAAGGEWAESGGPNYVGVDNTDVQNNPDTYVGELFRGPFFQKTNVPATAPAGGTVNISGAVKMDNPGLVLSARPVRVVLESPALSQPRRQRVGEMKHGQTRPFSFDIPIPEGTEQTLTINLKAQSKGGLTGWGATSTAGPFDVKVVTAGEHRVNQSLDYIPWAVGGAGVGYIVNSLSDEDRGTRLTLGGAAAGVGLGVSYDQLGLDTFSLNLPTTDIAIIGGAALAVVLLLNQTGADEVLQPAGEAAGSVVGGARDALSGDGTGQRRLPSQ